MWRRIDLALEPNCIVDLNPIARRPDIEAGNRTGVMALAASRSCYRLTSVSTCSALRAKLTLTLAGAAIGHAKSSSRAFSAAVISDTPVRIAVSTFVLIIEGCSVRSSINRQINHRLFKTARAREGQRWKPVPGPGCKPVG